MGRFFLGVGGALASLTLFFGVSCWATDLTGTELEAPPSASPFLGVTEIDDAFQDKLDSLIQDLEGKYAELEPDEFWHPYVYGTGNENRELLHVADVEVREVGGLYIQWKYARLGLKHYLIGLKSNQIDILGSDFKLVTSFTTKEDLEAITVFTKWNEEKNRAEMVILTASAEPRLNLYLFKDNAITSVASFPLHYAVKSIEFCHVGLSSKAVLVPLDPTTDIDIYNVEVHNSTQVWFFQRISSKENSNVVVYDSDMLESVIAISGNNKLYIHTFDVKAGLFIISQDIELPNPCQRLFSFTVAYQHYIGCVPVDPNFSVRFVSFNYNKNEYILEDEDNSFTGSKVISVHPIVVPDYTDQYFTLTLDVNGVTRIMVYHGRQSGFQNEYNCTSQTCPKTPLDLSKGVGFRHQDYSAFIFPSGDQTMLSIVWLITTNITDSSSPLVDESRLIYNNYKELSKRFDEWEKNVMSIEKVLNNSLKVDQPNILDGSWDVEKISTSNLLLENGKNLKEQIFQELKFIGSEWTEDDFKTDMRKIKAELSLLKKDVSFAKLELDNAILVDDDNIQHVSSPQRVKGMFHAVHLRATKISTHTLADNLDVKTFLNLFVSKSSDIRIPGELVFENLATVAQLNATFLNQVPISSIAIYSKENVFECPVQFNDGLTAEGNVVTPTINGVRLAEELMLVSNISGVNFVDGFVIENNTKSLGSFSFDKVLLKSSVQIVESSIHFDQIRIISPVEVTNIDGYNLNNFLSSVVTQGYTGQILGRKTVTEPIDTGTLNIGSTWNNVSFPGGFVQNKQNRVIFDSSTTFDSLSANKATIGRFLNGVLLDDLITRNDRQELKTFWKFSGPVTIVKDLPVSGLVDDVDMKKLAMKDNLNSYRDVHTYADVEFEHDVVIDTLQISHDINNQTFEEIFDDLMIFNGTRCEIPGVTTLLFNLTLDSIIVDSSSVNGQPLDTFFLINGDQNITGNIVLTESCNFNSLFALESYDTVNLEDLLNQTIRLTGPNKLFWEASFESIKCGDSIKIEGPINDIVDFGEHVAVISGRHSQTFTSPISFQRGSFASAIVENDLKLTEYQKLGGLEIQRWNERRLSLTRNENVSFKFEVDGLVKASEYINTQILNNVTLRVLAETALRTGVLGQVFSAHVTFNNSLEAKNGKVTFEDTISGYNLKEIAESAFPLNSSENGGLLLTGLWRFEKIIVIGNLNIKGLTCGVNLEELASDLVRKDEKNIAISGSKNFFDLTAKRSVGAETINGKSTTNLFTFNTNQTITCPFKINKNMKVNGNLQTDGYVNQVSTAMLSKTYSLKGNNTHVIHSDYEFNHDITTDKLTVKGKIQEKSFADAANGQHFIRVDDIGVKLTGHKTFLAPVEIKKDSKALLYNGLEIEQLQFQRLNEDVAISSSIVFKGFVHSQNVEVTNTDISIEMINGISWNDILQNSIPLKGEINPQDLEYLTFDIAIVNKHLKTKYFQGRDFEDFIKLDGTTPNIDHLYVRKAKVTGSEVTVGGLFHGHNLQEEFDNTIMKEESEYNALSLNGKKTFMGTVTVKGDMNCFGPDFKENVIDISKPFRISTPLEFTKVVYIEKGLNVSGTIQGYTIEEILADALTTNDDQPITGEWKFERGVTFKDDVYGPGELKNFDVQSLINETEYEVRAAGVKINSQKYKFVQECQRVRNVTEDILFNPMKLDAFDKHQTIILQTPADKLVTIKSSETLVLLTHNTNCMTTKYEWQNTSELFNKSVYPNLDFGNVNEWESVTLESEEGLLVFSTRNSTCSSLIQGLHVAAMSQNGKFSKIQTLLHGDVKAFKVIGGIGSENTVVFAITKAKSLHIFTWENYRTDFSRMDKDIESSYDLMDVVEYRSGAAIVMTGKNDIRVVHFNFQHKTVTTLVIQSFLASHSISPAIFESFGVLYILAPQKGTQLSESQHFSTIQVFSLVNKKLVNLHQLPFSDVAHRSVINFSHQIFVSLLSNTYGLNIYKFQGLSGLQRLNENPIKVFDGLGMLNFKVKAWEYSAPRPFIAVLTRATIEIYHSNVYGDSLDHSSKNICKV